MTGRRKMPKLLDITLKVMLSVSMVTGSIPTTALAEALDDEPQVEEGVVAEDVQIDEGELDSAEDEATVEEAATFDEQAPSDEEAVTEEAPVADEVAKPAEEAAPVEETAPAKQQIAQADPAQSTASPQGESEDEPELTASGVTSGTSTTEYPTIEDHEPIDIEVGEGEYWVGHFTAPASGTYSFYSEGTADTYGSLYQDAELISGIYAYDENLISPNFYLEREMEAGEDVYLMVGEVNDEGFSCTVTVEGGIDIREYSCDGMSRFVYDGEPHAPYDLRIGYFDDGYEDALSEGSDYEFSYWWNINTCERLDYAPVEIGQYCAVYHGIGEYRGLYTASFQIVDGNGLSNGSINLDYGDYPLEDGSFTLGVTVYDAAGNQLTEGEDFVLEYATSELVYDDYGYGAYEYVALNGTPSQPGWYYVRAAAIGDTYTGTTDYCQFLLFDIHDLAYGRIDMHTSNYVTSDEPVALNATVYDHSFNELTEGVDFTFKYIRLDTVENDEGQIVEVEVELDGAPSTPGDYYVRAAAIGDTYTGITGCEFFTICDVHDLALGYISLNRYDYYASGDPIVLEADVYDGMDNLLTEDEDYVFKFYSYEYVDYGDWGQSEYVELDGAPSEPGSYYVSAHGEGAYEGDTQRSWIRVYGPSDLRYGWIDLHTYDYEATGEPVELDATVYDAAGNQLTEGEDFYYKYYYYGEYEVDDGEYGTYIEEGWVELDGAPSEIGDYTVRAFASGNYYEHETGHTNFSIVEPFNAFSLAFGHININKSTFELGQELSFTPTISNSDYEVLAQDVDYQFKCYTNEYGEELDGDPTEAGTYYVVYEGINSYTGTIKARFFIIEPVVPVTFSLGTTDIEVASGSYWVGVFMASQDGDYSFYTEGNYDTYGYLYADEALSNEIVHDDDSAGNSQFLLYTHLAQGQTVYLKVRQYSNEHMQCSVVAARGKALASVAYSCQSTQFVYDGASHTPVVTFRNGDNEVLVEGTDYQIQCYVNNNGNSFTEAPTAIGQYRVIYEGLGDYTGTRYIWFSIVDASSLSSSTISLSSSYPKLIDGVVNLTVTVTDAAGSVLTEGVHYYLTYEKYDDATDDYVAVDAPTVTGHYYVSAVAIEGGGYTGSTGGYGFYVVDPYDISGSDYSCYFRGSYSKPLVDGTFDISDLVLYNYEEDVYLIQDTDYEIKYYRDNYGTILTNPPTEPGYYTIVLKGIGSYSGECTCSLRLYDPLSLNGAGVSLQGYVLQRYDDNVGEFVYYYFYDGSPVEPSVSVYITGTPLDSSAYTVTYTNNDHAHGEGEYATVTIAGVSPYSGSTVRRFKIVNSLDIRDFINRFSCYIDWDGQSDYVDAYYPETVEYLATGQAITPTISFSSYGPDSPSFDLEYGVDYTYTYEDANGNTVDAARAVGAYALVLSGVEGGKLSGTLRVPFALVESVDLGRGYNLNLDYNGSYSQSWYYDQAFTIHDLATGISDLAWSIWRNGVQLIENLDYVIEYVENTVGNFITVNFQGIGSYKGTVRADVYFDQTAQDSLNGRGIVRNTIYGFGSYSSYIESLVYVDSNGVIEEPQVTISGLTQGIDYEVEGVYNAQGTLITTASVGDRVSVKVVGIGAYADATRSFDATVVEGTAAPDIAGSSVYLLPQNAWLAYANGSNQYYMKRGVTPSVFMQVYGSNLLLQEGQGFTVTTALSSDNNSMILTAVADDSGLLRGSDTLTINLRDTFDFNEILGLGGSMGYAYISDLDGGSASYQYGSSSAVQLTYRGYEFVPSVNFMRFSPQYTVTLYQGTSATRGTVDAINGAGTYTMVVTGTGDWSGSFEVPLKVVDASADGLSLSRCVMGLGNAQLVNGKAEPTVTISYGDTTFTKDVDYTVEYGGNTSVGAHAWVRVTAVEGGRLTGVRSHGFTVSGASENKDLSSRNYSLVIQDPTVTSGTSYYAASQYTARAFTTGSEPQVMVIDNINNTPVNASNYDVTYGNNTTPGSRAYVTVTGKGSYTGSRSANYYVYGIDERVSIADAVVTTAEQAYTFTGSEIVPTVTVTLDGVTLVEGTDYTLSCDNAIHVGTATVTALGKGAYKGAASSTFQITPYQLTENAVAGVEDQYYDGGSEVTLDNLTVTALGKTLVAGTDYEVTYQNNTQVGEAIVIVTGMGDYAGTITNTFQINEQPGEPTTGDWVDEQAQAVNDAANALEQAQQAEAAAQGEVDDIQAQIDVKDAEITAAQATAQQKHAAADAAAAAVTTAQQNLTNAQNAYNANEDDITAAQAEVDRLQGLLDNGAAAELEALEAAQDALAAAQEAVPAKQAALDAANAEWDKGSFGFFQYVGATEALNALTNCTYASLNVQGDSEDATALDNMKNSFAHMYYLNQLRSSLGLSELKVTDYLMACAQADANYSDTVIGHAKQFKDFSLTGGTYGENVAWGYSNPYDGWYGEEKALFDAAYTSITGNTTVPTGAAAYNWYQDNQSAVTNYLNTYCDGDTVGHYTNTINPNFNSSGFAINTRSTLGYGNCMAQYYGGTISGSYTVAEYEARFMSYYNMLQGDIADAQAELEEAQAAVTTAQANVNAAQAAYDEALAGLETVQADLAAAQASRDALIANRTSLQAAIDSAQANLTTAQQSAQAASAEAAAADATVTQLQGEKATLQSQLATAQDQLATAQANTATAQQAYDEAAAALSDAMDLSKVAVTVSFDQSTYAYTGSALMPTPVVTVTMPDNSTVTLVKGVDYSVSYANNVNTGTATVTITGLGSETSGWHGSTQGTFTIVGRALTDAMVAAIADQVYTGSEIKPEPVVTDGETLVKGTHYTVSYQDNINVGTAKVIVEGMGSYEGTVEREFQITGKPMTGASISAIADQTYAGQPIEPTVTVALGGKTLVENTDYTVAYGNNLNVGTATVAVNGIGNYAGDVVTTFDIVGKPVTVTAASATKTYGSADPEFSATAEGLIGSDTIAYELARDAGENVGTYAITPAGDEVQGNYVVTFVPGELAITPKELTSGMVSAPEDKTYTGDAITQDLVVTDGSKTLAEGVDYTITCDDVNVGEATVTVTGMGNYEGSIEQTFQILPKSIEGLQVRGAAKTYTGSALTTTVTVKDGTRTLTRGTDFTVESWDDNVDAGTGTFVVKGMGNYTGQANGAFTINRKAVTVTANDLSKTYRSADPALTATVEGLAEVDGEDAISYTVSRDAGSNVGTYAITPAGEEVQGNYTVTFVPGTFTIKARSITKATVASIAAKTYTGSALKPTPAVKDGTKTLKKGTDYTIAYKNNVNKGTATVTIKGKGNYSGSKSVTFTIKAKAISGATASSVAKQKWTGKAIKPTPTVKMGTKTLKKGTDYTLAYSNNVNPGTATITIKGKGNYSGSKTVKFTIGPKTGTWKQSGSKWWYEYTDGTYPKSQFADIDGSRYYFDASGYMVTGWKQIGGKYYYFGTNGIMVKSKWVGNYYLKADGTMAVNEWVDGGKYHVNSSGVYDKSR